MAASGRADNMVKVAGRVLALAILLFALSVGWVAVAAVGPVTVPHTDLDDSQRELVTTDRASAYEVKDVLARMAGRRLVRPARIIAAVKDTGAAERLVKRLKLQGVISMGGKNVAYVQVDGKRTVSVRENEKLMEMVVQKIDSGSVLFSLDGVEAQLTY
jgi:hypothetical protein